jgi:hypothetical protein
LVRPRWTQSAPLHAIVVPSARPAEQIEHAADLAVALGCALIVLASKAAKRIDILALLASKRLPQLYVFDFPESVQRIPEFKTSRLLLRDALHRGTDVSAKRNLGLAIAWMAGLKNVLFLDDDVVIPQPKQLKAAAGLLRYHHAVGLRFDGFPDNSVVCHANRTAGGVQDTFVGGGALIIDASKPHSFFPDNYNEDWFFLLSVDGLPSVTLSGRAVQKVYDPFADPGRARVEELGDVLAEGLYARLDDKQPIQSAGVAYWQEFIKARREFILDTLRRTRRHKGLKNQVRKAMVRSLLAARDQLDHRVKPEFCAEYVQAWLEDVQVWREFRSKLPTGMDIESAFAHFGLGTVGAETGRVSTAAALGGQEESAAGSVVTANETPVVAA